VGPASSRSVASDLSLPAAAGVRRVAADPRVGRRLVFNRTVTLKDTWAKIEKRQ